MTKIKAIINFLDTVFLSFWGLTIFEILSFVDLDFFNTIDNSIKTIMALLGCLYFLVSLPYKVKKLNHEKKMNDHQREMNTIERKIKLEELEKLEYENNNHNDTNN